MAEEGAPTVPPLPVTERGPTEVPVRSVVIDNPVILRHLAKVAGTTMSQLDQIAVGGLAIDVGRLRGDLDALKDAGVNRLPTLEEAAELLLGVMEPNHQDRIKDASHENQWPKWVIMLGAVARACDNMELLAGEFNPDWLNDPGGVKPTAREYLCEGCQKPIPGARRGQRFCCSAHGSGKDWHSEGCPIAVVFNLPQGKPAAAVLAEVQAAMNAPKHAGVATDNGRGGFGRAIGDDEI